jgi:pSer/pThr/pTyr-binding forkhead associated (FHA) protein
MQSPTPAGRPDSRRAGLAGRVAGSALARQGLAGAAGGFLVFLLLELAQRASDIGGGEARSPDFAAWRGNVFLVGALFGGLVTAFLAVTDAWSSGSRVRMAVQGVAGALVGAVLSAGYSVVGNALYDTLGASGEVFARTVGWSLFGLGVGLSAGLLSRSQRRVYQGCVGGLGGGFAGGFLFNTLALATGGGAASRLVGYTVLGAAVGLATALVEELSKVAWIVFLSGSREGRQIILHRDESLVGRDELADIPLFGDGSVAFRHAVLSLAPAPRIEEIAGTEGLRVDGQPVRQAPLYDGAVIALGKHRFRFHHRSLSAESPAYAAASGLVYSRWTSLPTAAPTAGGPPAPVPPPAVELPPAPAWESPPPASTDVTVLSAPEETRSGGLVLKIIAGPGKGRVVPLEGSMVTLGRELTNSLPLEDVKASRYHLRIDLRDGAWVLKDLESTNGTKLNGLRVSRAGLAPGDRIFIGETVIAVEAAEN